MARRAWWSAFVTRVQYPPDRASIPRSFCEVLTGRSQHHTFILKEIITMSFVFQAEVRSDLGKGASRRLRHADLVPAIVYGAKKPSPSPWTQKPDPGQEKLEFHESPS